MTVASLPNYVGSELLGILDVVTLVFATQPLDILNFSLSFGWQDI